ncbi:hypothetical protein NLO95_28925, partial [Pseudomonas syringae]|nr:hypothetical protein [Pseudomonas syringae]
VSEPRRMTADRKSMITSNLGNKTDNNGERRTPIIVIDHQQHFKVNLLNLLTFIQAFWFIYPL